MSAQWVYSFEEGSGEMSGLLGGKGSGIAEMVRAGMPVPPGSTITTEACRAYLASGGRLVTRLAAAHAALARDGRERGRMS